MKTNLFLTGLGTVLLSLTGANAVEYHPFIGATMGVADLGYSSEADNSARVNGIDNPSDFFSFGIEGGVRFGNYNEIYNGGVTLNIDMTDTQKIRDKFSNAKFADTRTFAMSATYDNYLRLSGDKTSRIDLVLGAGIGTMNYDIDFESPIMSDKTIYSPMFAFKAALDFELTHNVILSAQARMFAPTRSHYDINAQYIFGGAIKYQF